MTPIIRCVNIKLTPKNFQVGKKKFFPVPCKLIVNLKLTQYDKGNKNCVFLGGVYSIVTYSGITYNNYDI